jgi:beta-galactosidase/beta-glucuronidase
MTPRPDKLGPGHLTTPWTADVDSELPLPEYPRPQMVREGWQNLNGRWDYAITQKDDEEPVHFPGKIVVPFPIESALSGIQQQLKPDERLWYRRTFYLDKDWGGNRVLLHFGAVDWECKVWVNNLPVGCHQGGYDPFTFDITAALVKDENEITVSVWDPSDSEPIQRGKQVLKPGFIWYTTISGIWQTVWLEVVPETYLKSIKLTPDIDRECLTITAEICNHKPDFTLRASVIDEGNLLGESETNPGQPLTLPIANPRLWSPDSPHLYDLELSLFKNGQEVDRVGSYFGMRKFSLGRDQSGNARFCLNNKPLFLYGPLDQGYWPDGLYTPPTDEAMRWEIDFIKDAGFNMLRKHIKVEPARYYFHCDRAGLIVWQDMISGGISPKPAWFLLVKLFKGLHDDRMYWRLGRSSQENRSQFKVEYQRMIDTLYNVISIGIWCPFNEGWGQFDAAEIATWTKAYDPTRLVDHASGWFDQGAGDFKSEHVYFKPLPKPELETKRALVLSEFGGYSQNLPEHAWNPNKDFGYKKLEGRKALTEGYLTLLEEQLLTWVRSGCSAAVYTQTTDVETEMNGFLTYDRKVIKLDLDRLRPIHAKLYKESLP